jgi:hypothetical protein
MYNLQEAYLDVYYDLDEAKEDEKLTPLQKIRKRNNAYSIPGEPAGQQTSNSYHSRAQASVEASAGQRHPRCQKASRCTHTACLMAARGAVCGAERRRMSRVREDGCVRGRVDECGSAHSAGVDKRNVQSQFRESVSCGTPHFHETPHIDLTSISWTH